MDNLTNRIENSHLIQVSLDDYYSKGDRVLFDIKELLYEDLVLIEKNIRAFVKQNDWSIYQDKYVGIFCSTNAIVPLWAFMLVASKIEPFAKKVVMGNKAELEKAIFNEVILNIDFAQFKDKSVIVKGCGKYPIPEATFVDFTVKLQKYAKTIMFGEACSAVPLFKKK